MKKRVCNPAAYRAKAKHKLPKWLMKVERVKATTSSAKHTKNIIHRPPSGIPRVTISCGITETSKIPSTDGGSIQTITLPTGHGQGIGAKALAPIPKSKLILTDRSIKSFDPLPPIEIEEYVSYGAVRCKN